MNLECLYNRCCHVVFFQLQLRQMFAVWTGGGKTTQLLKHITACSDSSHITLIFWFNYSHHGALFEMKSVCGGGAAQRENLTFQRLLLCAHPLSLFLTGLHGAERETHPKNYRTLWKWDETRYISRRFTTCVTVFACLESDVMNSFLSPRVFTSLDSQFW